MRKRLQAAAAGMAVILLASACGSWNNGSSTSGAAGGAGSGDTGSVSPTVESSSSLAAEPTVSVTSMDSSIQNGQVEKYLIGGTDAFYILPAHRPASGITNFKLLDMPEDNTFVYSYQATITADNADGLGNAGESGTAENTRNYESDKTNGKTGNSSAAGKSGTDSAVIQNNGNLADIVMLYHADTKQYRVLFHAVTPASDNAFFTQKYAGTSDPGQYFVFCGNVAALYDISGKKTWEYDVSELLSFNARRYGTDKGTAAVTKAVLDTDKNLFLSMQVSKKPVSGDSSITSEDTVYDAATGQFKSKDGSDEAASGMDLKDFTNENKSNELMYLSTCFRIDLGEPGEGEPADEDKSYFVSQNTNFEKQVQEWKTNVDGKSFEFSGSHEPSMDEIHKMVYDGDTVRKQYPDTYGIYQYADSQLPLKLYWYSSSDKEKGSFWKYGQFWNGSASYAGNCELEGANPSNMVQEQRNSRAYRYVAVNQNEKDPAGQVKYLFDKNTKVRYQKCEDFVYTRKYEIVWYTTETHTNDQNAEVTVTIRHSKEISESMPFIKAYSLHFLSPSCITWTEDRLSLDNIEASPGHGLIREITDLSSAKEDGTGTKAFAEWDCNSLSFSGTVSADSVDSVFGLCSDGSGKNNLLVIEKGGSFSVYPNAIAQTENGAFPNPSAAVPFEVPGKLINKEEKLLDSGSAVTMAADGTRLYLAGKNNGLLELDYRNAAAAAESTDTSTALIHLSRFPYFGLFRGKDGKLAAIGYQSKKFNYDDSDIICAKLYTIDVNKAREDEKRFQNLLKGSETLKNEAIKEAMTLARVNAGSRNAALSSEIAACTSTEALEDIMVRLNPDLDKGKSTADDITVTEKNGTEDAAAAERRAEGAKRARILTALQQEDKLTANDWSRKLNNIIFNLHIPTDPQEYYLKNAVRTFADMCGQSAGAAVEAGIRTCKTKNDLTELILKFQMGGTYKEKPTGEDSSTAESDRLILKQRSEALILAQTSYMENSVRYNENGSATYLKSLYGTTWNTQWESSWNSDLEGILSAFRQSK